MGIFTKLLGSGQSTNGTSDPTGFLDSFQGNGGSFSASLWEWALTSEQIEHEAQNGLIPMTMPVDPVPHLAAMHLWLAWQGHVQSDLKLQEGKLVWLPVGRLGPIPVMGHFNPRHSEAECPVGNGYFQPVLLTPVSYQQYYKRCAELQAEFRVKIPAEVTTITAPVHRFLDDLPVVCEDIPHALRFILDHYALSEKERFRINDVAERPVISWGTLPPGLRTAATFLCRRALVADLTLSQGTSGSDDLIPISLRKSVRTLSELPGNLWIAVQELMPDSAIDEINHHLPETRKIHQVLYDTDTGRSSAGTRPGSSFNVAKVVQQGSSVKKEHITLVVDASIKRVDLKRPVTDARETIRRLCWDAIERNASDLHIEPLLTNGLVRERVDQSLVEVFECTEETYGLLVGAAKNICGMGPEPWDVQDKQFTLRISRDGVNADYSVRVAAAPVRNKIQGLVFRFLPKGGKIRRLEELRISPRNLKILKHMIRQPQGLILVCGPTGSGKTTTIAASIQEINTADIKVITIEDPIEYELDRVMQMQVDENRDIGFDALLKEAMRLDPDVALLGEMRDKESADASFKLAITGHLVFSTLHTLSSAKAPVRLEGWGVDMGVVSESLLGIVSQRLYPCLCPHCRQLRKPNKAELRAFERSGLDVPTVVGQRTDRGCKECRGTGFLGSIAAMEIIRNTEEVSELIARRGRAKEIEEQAMRQGDTLLQLEALRHVASGTIESSDALRASAVWEQGWDESTT